MNVHLYQPDEDDYTLKDIPAGKFQTLVISHVLEHIENPAQVLKKLMDTCNRIGVKRIFIVVPCEKGFAHDKTHLTFITRDFIRKENLENRSEFHLVKWGYFPFNFQFIGKLFVYNELYLMYDHA